METNRRKTGPRRQRGQHCRIIARSRERGGSAVTGSPYVRPAVAGCRAMGEGLLETFRHNAWANRALLDACRELSKEQLGATAEGTYGSVLATLQHIVDAE